MQCITLVISCGYRLFLVTKSVVFIQYQKSSVNVNNIQMLGTMEGNDNSTSLFFLYSSKQVDYSILRNEWHIQNEMK